MRPAQKAPENEMAISNRRIRCRDFNEAGAKSAGKPRRIRGGRFEGRRTSMRPAQKAPENVDWLESNYQTDGNFNEAGAKSAGKQADSQLDPPTIAALQ